jgi:MOSC domain-containing protein YiiM
MKIISVNIGRPEPLATDIADGRQLQISGINKKPSDGAVFIGKLGLADDCIIDGNNHGGVDQAVYLYSQEDYAWWESQLGRTLQPGTFGEIITVAGLESAGVLVGDRFRIGKVLLEATSPRIPCNTLALQMHDKQFVKRFMAAGRPGVYCRVLGTGDIKSGDQIIVEPHAGVKLNMLDMFENFPLKNLTEEQRTQYLAVPAHWKVHAFLRGERAMP